MFSSFVFYVRPSSYLLSVQKKTIRNIIFSYNQVTSDPEIRSPIQSSCSCADSPFLYPPAGHVITGDLACIPDKGLRSFLRKGQSSAFHPGLILLNAGVLSRKNIRLTVNDGVGRKASVCMPLTTGKNEFLRIVDILLHIHINQNSHLVVQWKQWKGKWKHYTVNMSLHLPTMQQIMSSLSEKDTTWMFWRRNWILRVHMYLLSWRKTNFFCVISILSQGEAVAERLSSWLAEQEDQGSIPGLATWIFRDWLSPASKSRYCWEITQSTIILKQLTNNIDSLTKSNIKIQKLDLPPSYWLRKQKSLKSRFISNSSHFSTTILSKHITSALTAVKDHVIKYSETALSTRNVNYLNSSEVIEKLRLRIFRGSQVSSSDFSTLYISLPIDLIKAKVLSRVKWCLHVCLFKMVYTS